jgi:hypothetical protein
MTSHDLRKTSVREAARARRALAEKLGELVGVPHHLIAGWSVETAVGAPGPVLTLELVSPQTQLSWDEWTEIRRLQQQVPGRAWGTL